MKRFAFAAAALLLAACQMKLPDESNKVAAPVFEPGQGAYSSTVEVEITCATPGATVFYTTDGSMPNGSSSVYTTPITISATTTFKAVATKSGLESSDLAAAVYTVSLSSADPVVSPIGAQTAYLDRDFYLNVGAFVTDDGAPSDLSYAVTSGPGAFSGPVYLNHFAGVGTVSVAFSVTDATGNSASGSFDVTVIRNAADPLPFPAGTVFVSPAGTDTATSGSLSAPCRTISYGLSRATSLGAEAVVVACGYYPETVTLVNDIDLLGGYDASFSVRDLTGMRAVISSNGPDIFTVRATGLSASTVFEGFVVEGPRFVTAGTMSVGILVTDCASALEIRSLEVYAGRGGDGNPGTAGQHGTNGTNGQDGANPFSSATRTGSTAGGLPGFLTTFDFSSISGGSGGSAGVPVYDFQEGSGAAGVAAAGGGASGAGGSGGWSSKLNSATILLIPTMGGREGSSGSSGANGVNGPVGVGGSGSGSIVAGRWVAASGVAGSAGGHGGGGGGGGASGGIEDPSNYVPTWACIIGASGGGGGSGGEAGRAGTGGSGGGGCFGIFVHFTATPVSFPAISGCTIHCRVGGTGGNGGTGGIGGRGGSGGQGRSDLVNGWGVGPSGNGGSGGSGGAGGGGGGGAGGMSAGIFVNKNGSSAILPYAAENTIDTASGAGGTGGTGGLSYGNIGQPGSAGALAAVHYWP